MRSTGPTGTRRRTVFGRVSRWPRRSRRFTTSWARRWRSRAIRPEPWSSSNRPSGCRRPSPRRTTASGSSWRRAASRSRRSTHWTAAIKAEPGYVEPRLQLANMLRRGGQFQASLAHYDYIITANPRVAEARFGYAASLIRLRRYAEARERLETAMRDDPAQAAFATATARLLAAAPDDRVRDGRRALAIVQRLIDKGLRTLDALETMAMAQAEMGQFSAAVMWQRDAMAAAERLAGLGVAGLMAGNLRLYEAASRAARRGGPTSRSNFRAPLPTQRWTLAEAGHYDEAPHTVVPDALEGLVEQPQEPDQTRRVCQPDRHDDRVVRLLPLRHGRRARLQQALLPDVRPAGRHDGRVRHLRGRLRRAADRRHRLRPLTATAWAASRCWCSRW